MRYLFPAILLYLFGISCTKQVDAPPEPKLIFRFKFDSTQARLNNQGQPAALPENQPAQSPAVHGMSAHYIELVQDAHTALGEGAILYLGEETDEGGDTAIYVERAVIAGNNEIFYAISLKDIPAGEYEYLRLSIAYQNFTIGLHIDSTINDSTHIEGDFHGTVASFIGYNNYITSYIVRNEFITVDTNKLQGYWGLETAISGDNHHETITLSGQSPAGGTTVVNPLYDTAPIPPGSSVITAAFVPGKLTITGNESENIIVEVSLSTNKSFEWEDIVANGKWDPLKEPVLDMGLRGMIPSIRE